MLQTSRLIFKFVPRANLRAKFRKINVPPGVFIQGFMVHVISNAKVYVVLHTEDEVIPRKPVTFITKHRCSRMSTGAKLLGGMGVKYPQG